MCQLWCRGVDWIRKQRCSYWQVWQPYSYSPQTKKRGERDGFMPLTEKRLFSPPLPQFKAFKTELLASQSKWIYSMGLLAVRLMVCTEVPGAKVILLSELVFEFSFSHLVTAFHKRQVTSPWSLPAANCKVFGACKMHYMVISSSSSWSPLQAQIWMLLKHGKQWSDPALFFSEGVNGLGLVLSLYSTYHNFNGL